jgi:hypothetical protein
LPHSSAKVEPQLMSATESHLNSRSASLAHAAAAAHRIDPQSARFLQSIFLRTCRSPLSSSTTNSLRATS